ncbi:hypothetical protein BJ912DRAFT_953927 [Pholiota molesta]|nr:hypothetical protein BJ912DRAFT_953927 [Pholiota molesta]
MPRISFVAATPPPSQAPVHRYGQLKARMSQALNLTTYDPSAPGCIREINFPATPMGQPIAPNRLWRMTLTHDIPVFYCFHHLRARIFVVRGKGPNAGMTHIACHFSIASLQCTYWISVDAVAAGYEQGLNLQQYIMRFASSSFDELPMSSQSNHLSSDGPDVQSNNKSDKGLSSPAINIESRIDEKDTDLAAAIAESLKSLDRTQPTTPEPPSHTMAPRKGKGKQVVRKGHIRILSTPPPSDYPSPKQKGSSAPSFSRLQLPSPDNAYYTDALQLRRGESSTGVPFTPIPPRPAPPRGYFLTVLDLISEDAGVPPDVFWGLFTLCRGCNRIMTADLIHIHACNLTDL